MMDSEKRNNILQFIEDNDINVACISETWFDAQNGIFTSSIKEAGYDLIHGHRENKRGGGTAIIFKKTSDVKPGEASTTKFTSFEFSYIILKVDKSKIVLVCLYRKQELPCNLFCEEVEKLMETISNKGDIVILVGDFNLWDDVEGDKDADDFRNLMTTYGQSQLIREPTHREGHTLDHVYVNQYQMELKCTVMKEMFGITTDHYPIIIELPKINNQQKKRTITYRNFKDCNTDEVVADFKNMFDQLNRTTSQIFETNYLEYDSQSRQLVEKHFPLTTKTIKENRDPPWMDTEYKLNRSRRRKLKKECKKNTEYKKLILNNGSYVLRWQSQNRQSITPRL